MRTILVSEAGGALSNGVIESLLAASFHCRLVGVSSDPYALALSNCHQNHLVPPASDPRFIDVLNDIIVETKSDLVVSQHDDVILPLAAARDRLKAPVFLPPFEVIQKCQNKDWATRIWQRAGLPVPKTFLIKTEQDLENAFSDIGGMVWLRKTRGGGGLGSLPTKDVDFAYLWIARHDGWGLFNAAEYLGPKSTTFTSIWKNGRLVVGQGRKRLSWKYGNRTLSGVTGITAVGETASEQDATDLAIKAILAIDPDPHGVYSVDMTRNKNGLPNLTEINIGRFFTTHLFFTKAGLNLSDILVRTALDPELPVVPIPINPLPPGLLWVREMDTKPEIVGMDFIKSLEEGLEERLE